MTQTTSIDEFIESYGKLPRGMSFGHEVEWLRSKLTTLVEQAMGEQKWQVHEVHGEGGKTLDGQTLYWAKVRAASTIIRDSENV